MATGGISHGGCIGSRWLTTLGARSRLVPPGYRGLVSDDLAITSGGAIFRRLRQLGVDIVLVNSGYRLPADHRRARRSRGARRRRAPLDRRAARARRDGDRPWLLLRLRPCPGGDAPHQRRARERCDRSDQRGERSGSGDPDVGSHANRRTRPLRGADRSDRVGSGDARPGGARARSVQMGVRVALPRAAARAARSGLRDCELDPEGPRLPQPAARGADRAVPGRGARRAHRHARGVGRSPRPTRSPKWPRCSPAPSIR